MVHCNLKIIKVGNSLGCILPKSILQALNVQKGESVYIVSTPDGILFTPYDLELGQKVKAAKSLALNASQNERTQLK